MPKGFPVTVLQATDGSIWLTDDKNHSVLRIARYNGTPYKVAPRGNLTEARIEMMKKSPKQLKRYRALKEALATNCKGCHDGFKLKTDKTDDEFGEFKYLEFMETWIKAGKPEESELYKRIRTDMSQTPPKQPGMPPPGSNLKPVDPQLVETTIKDFIISTVD